MYVKLAVAAPIHTAVLGPSVIVGVRFIVTVIGNDALTQPVVLFRTVIEAAYTPAAAPPGTAIEIGDAGNAAFTTSTNPCASAPALKSILYWSGELVVAE